MADEVKSEKAKKVYETLCTTLNNKGWHFIKDDEKLSIECEARGEDLPMNIEVQVVPERELILLFSQLPFVVPSEKRLDFAVAVTFVNNQLVNGSFDFNIFDGNMVFRLTNSFIESDIGEGLLFYMIMVSCRTVDDFNDKFFMLAKGMMSLEAFITDSK